MTKQMLKDGIKSLQVFINEHTQSIKVSRRIIKENKALVKSLRKEIKELPKK